MQHGTEASHIAYHLYMGSEPDPEAVVKHYDVLVLAAEEHQPSASHFPGAKIIRVPLDDGDLTARDKMKAVEAAYHVADFIRKEYRVLVTCHMGVNRSGLITALALLFLNPKMTGTAAIATVRRHRKLSARLKRDGFYPLCNTHFTKFLVKEASKLVDAAMDEHGW